MVSSAIGQLPLGCFQGELGFYPGNGATLEGMMNTYRDAWDDPNVREAIRTRSPHLIMLICCERCGNYGYYNEGSHFSCSVPACEWSVSGKELDDLIESGDVISLDDYTDVAVNGPDGP